MPKIELNCSIFRYKSDDNPGPYKAPRYWPHVSSVFAVVNTIVGDIRQSDDTALIYTVHQLTTSSPYWDKVWWGTKVDNPRCIIHARLPCNKRAYFTGFLKFEHQYLVPELLRSFSSFTVSVENGQPRDSILIYCDTLLHLRTILYVFSQHEHNFLAKDFITRNLTHRRSYFKLKEIKSKFGSRPYFFKYLCFI